MDLITFLQIAGTVVIIFIVTILITRIFGLRTFAKMSSFDFASTIAVGSVLATIIIDIDQILIKGSLILVLIIGFQTLFSYAVRKSKKFRSYFTNKPVLLMWEGKILDDQLQKCNVGQDDLLAKLREANVYNLEEVKAVVFESTGDISVLHDDSDREFDELLLHNIGVEARDKNN